MTKRTTCEICDYETVEECVLCGLSGDLVHDTWINRFDVWWWMVFVANDQPFWYRLTYATKNFIFKRKYVPNSVPGSVF